MSAVRTAVYWLLIGCVSVSSMSLKQNLSLLELEQQLSWIRAEVEAAAGRPLAWYLLADDEDALANQVAACARTHTYGRDSAQFTH